MTFEEICKREDRKKENISNIYFIREGDWWRAYEWSAYLATHYMCNNENYVPLKATKKNWNGNEDGICSVGLKQSSFEKYFPKLMDDDENFEIKDKEIVLRCCNIFKEGDYENYKELLTEWKKTIKSDKKEKKNNELRQIDLDFPIPLPNIKDNNDTNLNYILDRHKKQ